MNQKGFLNIILIVVIVVAVAGYFTLVKKPGPVTKTTLIPPVTQIPIVQTPSPAPKDETANWRT